MKPDPAQRFEIYDLGDGRGRRVSRGGRVIEPPALEDLRRLTGLPLEPSDRDLLANAMAKAALAFEVDRALRQMGRPWQNHADERRRLTRIANLLDALVKELGPPGFAWNIDLRLRIEPDIYNLNRLPGDEISRLFGFDADDPGPVEIRPSNPLLTVEFLLLLRRMAHALLEELQAEVSTRRCGGRPVARHVREITRPVAGLWTERGERPPVWYDVYSRSWRGRAVDLACLLLEVLGLPHSRWTVADALCGRKRRSGGNPDT